MKICKLSIIVLFPVLTYCCTHSSDKAGNRPLSKADSIAIKEKTDQAIRDSLRSVHAKQDSIGHAKDSLAYLSEPFIPTKEVQSLYPVIKTWLDFYTIELSRFKIRLDDSLRINFNMADDTLSPYYRKFDLKWHSRYTPQSRDYSPNRRQYINLLETTYVTQDENGKWIFSGSDDCQEIRYVNLDKKIDTMFMFTGTNFVDAARWKNNDCFILMKFDCYNNEFLIQVYDLKGKREQQYRLKEKVPENTVSFLEYDMKLRGIEIL